MKIKDHNKTTVTQAKYEHQINDSSYSKQNCYENIEIINSFWLLGLIINTKGLSSQKI